ncbi:MAG: Hpt domain-containing protein [Treponema sp.]|nr:Hpt domain-containing protein [Treponema sp.]
MSDIVYINIEEGLKRVMNNAMLFAKLLSKFKNYTHISEIEAAFAENDLEAALNSAHTLKGLAANLSLTELYKQVQELEAQIKIGTENNELLEKIKGVHAKTLEEADKVISQYA